MGHRLQSVGSLRSHHRRAPKAAVVIGIFLQVLPTSVLARSFCEDLTTMLGATPDFVSLRGTQTGSEFDGTLKFEGAAQCEIRNKSTFGTPIDQAKWTYECLWENQSPTALPLLRSQVQACLPQASYSEGSQFKNESWGNEYQGGIFVSGETSVVIDFHTTTNQLWLTIFPSGVELDK